jgi:hypothetical protein
MTSQELDNIRYLQVQTPHYNFEMKITKKEDTYYYFSVGDGYIPSIEGGINLENKSSKSLYNTAHLSRIHVIERCSEEDINQGYLNSHSIGKEMLDALIFLINSQFPSIKTLELSDTTYLPYKSDTYNSLDLLTYSIGLYKKTWYEEKLNAYILPKEKHEEYRRQVEEYASKDTKNSIPFFDIYAVMVMSNPSAANIVYPNMEMYEKMYEESESLPEFFQKISKPIKLEEKCSFFKGWLSSFINSKVDVIRQWHFDIYPKVKIIKDIKTKQKTRKQRKNPSKDNELNI